MSFLIPISIQRIIRKNYLPRARSNKTFERGVISLVDDIDKTILGQVGSAPGATILGFNADVAGLDIEEWANGHLYTVEGETYSVGPAKPFRYDVEYKLSPANKQLIQTSYDNLNSYTARCIPNEYPDE